MARQVAPEAVIRRLVPSEGRFVVPRYPLQKRWFFHVTVEADAHMVDALTGVDGTPSRSYLEEHWHYPECLRWVDEPSEGGPA